MSGARTAAPTGTHAARTRREDGEREPNGSDTVDAAQRRGAPDVCASGRRAAAGRLTPHPRPRQPATAKPTTAETDSLDARVAATPRGCPAWLSAGHAPQTHALCSVAAGARGAAVAS